MPHYETDGSCCCGDCCPSCENNCPLSYNVTYPSIFGGHCACMNGVSIVIEYNNVVGLYCFYGEPELTQKDECLPGIRVYSASLYCDTITCEWFLSIGFGTISTEPCSSFNATAVRPANGGCAPTGDWIITSYSWLSVEADENNPDCEPCPETNMIGAIITLTEV